MIKKGCPSANIILDRKEAIEYGLSKIKPGDIFIIAGKGHESYQLVSDRRLPFNDMEIVRNSLENINE